MPCCYRHCVFLFNDTAPTEIYTLSLHDALPISPSALRHTEHTSPVCPVKVRQRPRARSEEHTSELQTHEHLVCRRLLGKIIICYVGGGRVRRDEAACSHRASALMA